MILVNSGAFLSISSWFSELTELIFVMIPYIYSGAHRAGAYNSLTNPMSRHFYRPVYF